MIIINPSFYQMITFFEYCWNIAYWNKHSVDGSCIRDFNCCGMIIIDSHNESVKILQNISVPSGLSRKGLVSINAFPVLDSIIIFKLVSIYDTNSIK